MPTEGNPQSNIRYNFREAPAEAYTRPLFKRERPHRQSSPIWPSRITENAWQGIERVLTRPRKRQKAAEQGGEWAFKER